MWTRFRINYMYVFELDPRYTRSYIKIFNDCAVDSIAYFLCGLLYFKAVLQRLPFNIQVGCVVVWGSWFFIVGLLLVFFFCCCF